MEKLCRFCGKKIFDHGIFYCQVCASAARRAIRSKLNPRWKYSKRIRAILLEFIEELPSMGKTLKADTLDERDRREIAWIKRTFGQLAEACGGVEHAKNLVNQYKYVYWTYFNADDTSAD